MIKTAKELVAACLDVANNYKTLYVMGCFGAPMTASNKTRYSNNTSFNQKSERKSKIQAASADTFGFDCVCLIKGLLWGWNGNASHVYGGATYNSNGVPDKGADQMIAMCTEVSTDFSNIQIGEAVWLPGHIGIYVGGGKAVEATYAEEDGVQIQAVLPMGQIPGMPCTGWQKHGKLPWISYEEEPAETKNYRVTLEGVDSAAAEKLKADAKSSGWTYRVEEMVAEKPAEPAPAPVVPEKEWVPKEGDIVYFKGGMQYSQSNGTTGSQRAAGQAKITKVFDGKHPYHLVKTGSSGPYGWVDRNTFEKA